MQKFIYSLILLFVFQTGIINAQRRICATTEVNNRLRLSDPVFSKNQQELESFTANMNHRANLTVTIPVVFHILYSTNNTTQNISTNRILDQLQVLNDDFSASNIDISQVPAAFQGLIGNSDIQFCLAQRDPNGNATDGILRISTATSSFSDNDGIKFSASGGSNAWPRDQYLNIWVGNLSGGLLGYAQFPGGPANTDGVVLLNASVGGPNFPGTISSYNIGRTATHEIGHWLNLRHIWGDSNCGNDQVADTPTQQTANFSCPSFPHVTCSNGPNGDMFMNYMDYVDDDCMIMFSAGQATRMNAALSGSRVSLLTSNGCIPPVAAPVAAFEVSSGEICKNDQVTFTDISSNNPTSWSWSFPGGTPSVSSAQNPVVTYNGVGTYDVSLTVTNAGGGDSETITGFITVNGLPQVTINSENNANIVCAGSALTLQAISQSGNMTYQWFRNSVALPGAVNQTFDVTQTGNYKVNVTKPNGCSKTTANFRVDRVPLPTVSISASGPVSFCEGDSVTLTATFNPAYNYTWKKYSNLINGATGNSLTVYNSGKYKVVAEDANGCSRSSNSITTNVSCRVASSVQVLSVYPNPANNRITVSLNQPADIHSRLMVFDAMGRKLMDREIREEQLLVDLDITSLPNGLYTIKLKLSEEVIIQKFVVNRL